MSKTPITRRNFVEKATVLSGAALASGPLLSAAKKKKGKPIRIGWVGAGSKGAHDIRTCLLTDPNTELVAVAELFQDQLDKHMPRIHEEVGSQVKLRPSTTFKGFDGYKKILEMDEVDLVFFTTPPGFRPQHFKEAIEAGKHVFLEKPGAVDVTGAKTLIEVSKLAAKKGLTVAVGMQQRYMPQYIDIIQKVQDGAIGEVTHVGAYWLGTMKNWHWKPRQPEWSDVEYQIRTWPHWLWLSGDCCVEQLVHNLDISNWVLDKLPTVCRGIGGRIVRNGPEYGNIYDHFSFDYDYGEGVKGLGMNAQIEGISNKVMNTIAGTDGEAWVSRGGGAITGKTEYKYKGDKSGNEPMYKDMLQSIRGGDYVNHGERLANATLTGVLSRMAAYTGRALSWEWMINASKEDLSIDVKGFGPLEEMPPAIPGVTMPV